VRRGIEDVGRQASNVKRQTSSVGVLALCVFALALPVPGAGAETAPLPRTEGRRPQGNELAPSEWCLCKDDWPPTVSVDGLAGHRQEHNLSCESRSATDVAAFWGVTFTEDDFFRRLPKSDNPHRGFLGDVDLAPGTMPPDGYGVYVGPIAANLRSFGLEARAWREWSLDSLKAELVAGRPVIVWATYDMQLPGVETWVSSDGASSVVVKWQHTFVAVGYDEEGVSLVDAYDGVTKHFSYGAFLSAWEQLERMAVTVEGLLVQPTGWAWKATWAGPEAGLGFVVDGRWAVGPY
jgi:uncharacterized protein YvpB